MKITDFSQRVVTVNTYHITLKDGRNVIYKEQVNKAGAVEDFTLRDEDGHELGDEAAGIVDGLEKAITKFLKK